MAAAAVALEEAVLPFGAACTASKRNALLSLSKCIGSIGMLLQQHGPHGC
jgi:hypothetical protein